MLDQRTEEIEPLPQTPPAGLSGWEQAQAMLKSRKFWAMVTAIVAAAAALATNQITAWEFITVLVVAMGAYSTGVAIEDAGAKIGTGMTSPLPPLLSGEGKENEGL